MSRATLLSFFLMSICLGLAIGGRHWLSVAAISLNLSVVMAVAVYSKISP